MDPKPLEKLFELLHLLPKLNLYKSGNEECVMINVLLRESESWLPPLFQVIVMNTEVGKVYMTQELEEGSHQVLSKETFKEGELYKVLPLVKSAKKVSLLWGPYEIIS